MIVQALGDCLSGGLDLIGACDIVFAAEGTLFGHPAARGMGIPVMIGMLPTRIGAAATEELPFTGDLIDAAEARELGLVGRLLPADELDSYTLAFCQRVAMNLLDVLSVHEHVNNRCLEVIGRPCRRHGGRRVRRHRPPHAGDGGVRPAHQRGGPARRAGLARRPLRHRPARRARRCDQAPPVRPR
jgi:enoyl-CoA hydratase/carnithine racemase